MNPILINNHTDSFGPVGVSIEFDKDQCEMMKTDLATARELFRNRHLGNNKTMQKEKHIVAKFISLASAIIEESTIPENTEEKLEKPVTIDRIYRWLNQESLEAHNSETCSRNGESTDYDDGIFKGREEMANETIAAIESGYFKIEDGKIIPVVK